MQLARRKNSLGDRHPRRAVVAAISGRAPSSGRNHVSFRGSAVIGWMQALEQRCVGRATRRLIMRYHRPAPQRTAGRRSNTPSKLNSSYSLLVNPSVVVRTSGRRRAINAKTGAGRVFFFSKVGRQVRGSMDHRSRACSPVSISATSERL
jgi:hypothetical protein